MPIRAVSLASLFYLLVGIGAAPGFDLTEDRELRAGPTEAAPSLATLSVGDSVTQFRCRETDGDRWCLIAAGTAIGWVPAETLSEGRQEPAIREGLLDSVWTVAHLQAEPPSLIEAPWIGFVQGRAGGFAGCNRFEAPFGTAENDEIHFSPLALTRKACPGRMEAIERRFVGAIWAARYWAASEDAMALLDGDGRILAGFVRRDGEAIDQ
ncbi:MAG: META domain-containing protein [Paracoccaceae bacterium]